MNFTIVTRTRCSFLIHNRIPLGTEVVYCKPYNATHVLVPDDLDSNPILLFLQQRDPETNQEFIERCQDLTNS
jgi:hypothetical protein